MSAPPARVTIDLWSDVMCPWCLIGWHQLQRALATLEGEIAAEVRWRPFELNPDMSPEGEEQGAHIARKYGRSAEQAAQLRAEMQRIARQAGAELGWTGAGDPPPALMRNTFRAHRLLAWALETHGSAAQTRLKRALFAAHFNHRRDVSDPAVLMDIAQACGFVREEVEAALADPAWGDRVRREEAAAWDMNIAGVPALLVNGKFLIPGAQEPEVYVQALRRVVARG